MRRSVENAEHVGLFRHSSWKHKHTRRAATTHIQHNYHLLPASGLHSGITTMVDASSAPHISETTFKLCVTSTDVFVSIGLFAPRQGQMYREEQRRRRSQYDRGTPGAEFEAHTQHLTDPALSAYPSSSYAPTMNTSHYNNFPHPQGVPGPSTWYYHDY
jgi:hypothetical protein